MSYQCLWWCQNHGEHKDKFSVLFWFLAVETFNWYFGWHRDMVKREKWDHARWQKPVLSNSLIALGLIWWWLCTISGCKTFLDSFQDTQTADIFFWKLFKTSAHWKPLKMSTTFFKRYSIKVFAKYLWMDAFALGYYVLICILRAIKRYACLAYTSQSIPIKDWGN